MTSARRRRPSVQASHRTEARRLEGVFAVALAQCARIVDQAAALGTCIETLSILA